MAVEGAPSSPREEDISPRKSDDWAQDRIRDAADRSPARWEEEDDRNAPPTSGSASPSMPPSSEATSLLIRHLKFTTAPNVVRSYFESIGPVKDVYLPLEFESGRPRGFGFVEFQHAGDAQEALRTLNNTELDGSCISISVAQHGRKTPSLMRARSFGYGRGSRRGGYDRRRGEPYSAPDRYERSPPPKRRYDDRERERGDRDRDREHDRDRDRDRSDRLDDRPRYDRYSSRGRDYDRYYPRDGSPRGGPSSSDYERRRYRTFSPQ